MAGTKSQTAPSVDINLHAHIGIVCHKESWGALVKEFCVRSGFSNITLVYNNISLQQEPLAFDLIFLDEHYSEDMTGGELLDSLLINRKLNVTTAVIMVGEGGETVVHNYDSIILLLGFLPTSFSEQMFNQVVWHSLLAQKVFHPALKFVDEGKLAYAYRSMEQWDKFELPQELVLEFCKLYVNMAFDLGKYQKVLSICNKPKFKTLHWTVWPRFKANYELGNWTFCEQSLLGDSFTSLPSGSMKLFWQLRLLLEQERYPEVVQLINDYPKQDMSLSMIRLAFSALSICGEPQQAEEFIARKIRLMHKSPMAQASLINSQCSIFLYHYYVADTDELRNQAFENLKLHLQDFASHKKAYAFKYHREVFDLYLKIVELSQEPDAQQLLKLETELAIIEQHVTSPILMCRVAYAWHLLKQPEACFSALVKADVAFSYTPLGCERLLLSMMYKLIFFNVYPEQERYQAYKKLGQAHNAAERYKLACKAYCRALDNKADDKEARKLLAASMKKADIAIFSGYQIKQSELL